MAKKEYGEYYLGLDIGTDSLGWAVTDRSYNILRFNGKAMWGVHLFNEGKTAEERRGFRISRRRTERRKQKIKVLRELFNEEIAKVDPGFFQKEDESNLHAEDRKYDLPCKFDKEYHKKYPTVYHLRKDLMITDVKPDIRLVYLAAHHMIKYRGHFLFENLGTSDIPDFSTVFDQFRDAVDSALGIVIDVSENVEAIKSILLNNTLGVSDRKKELKNLLSIEGKTADFIAGLLSGSKVDLCKMMASVGIEVDEESVGSLKSICFKDASFEENSEGYESAYGSEIYNMLEISKQLYDWGVLSSILKGNGGISDVKISEYNQHKKDLVLLKTILKEYAGTHKDAEGKDDYSLYKAVFKSTKGDTYCNYSGKAYNRECCASMKKCKQSDFCDFIRKLLDSNGISLIGDPIREDMMRRLNDGTFMPKLRSSTNSIFPNALHAKELKAAMTNMERFYPFLSQKDENGLSVSDKIVSLCTFRIPYYVGPLGKNSKTGWAVRRSDGAVLPWNFEERIDTEASAEKFIENLISTCSYMRGEPVLPKNSPMYQRFMLYNEVNKISINGVRISQDLKAKLIDHFFVKGNKSKVTKTQIKEFVFSETGIKAEIGGIDEGINASLRAEHQLSAILGDFRKCRRMSEEIARILTIYGDDRKMLQKRLKSGYSDTLSKEQLKALSSIRFRDWGKLCGKMLTGIYSRFPDGSEKNIMSAMEQEPILLMELLSDKYSFTTQIRKANADLTAGEDITRESIDELYCSPAVKHAIWRVVSVINEIVKVTGHAPKKVFVETTREARDDGKKMSRKYDLLGVYKNAVKKGGPYQELLSNLEGCEESSLRSKRLYAYFLQLGHCAYCWKPIDLNDLTNSNMYDMDHIHPQSKKTDDSVRNNMVLSCRTCNAKKTNRYPINPEIQLEMKSRWDMLKSMGLMTSEKYSRLVRTTEFSDDELSGFINRQLVETSQASKAVAEILGRMFGENTDIVYVKGGNVSQFRHDQTDEEHVKELGERGFYVKARNVNDLHHAKDAYLNIVVGNVYDTKFTRNPLNYLHNRKKDDTYNLNRMFDFVVRRDDDIAWIPGKTGSISIVDKYMRRNNILYTREPYCKSGQLSKLQILKKGNGQLEVKKGLSIEKYGGYTELTGSYFTLVEHTIKGSRIRTIEAIPLHVSNSMGEGGLLEYFKTQNLIDPDIRIPCIRIDTMFEIDGFRCTLRSRTGNTIRFVTAEQLILPFSDYSYCKKIYNYEDASKERGRTATPEMFGLNNEGNISLYHALRSKFEGKYSIPTAFAKVGELMNTSQFESFDIVKQTGMLLELLRIFSCKPVYGKLKSYGGTTDTAGRIEYNKCIDSMKSVTIINQSVSGLFEYRGDLKSI